jgi:acylglycerol lipase
MSTEEGSHTLADGQKLYTKTWKVRSQKELPRAVLTHHTDEQPSHSTIGVHTRLLGRESLPP